jgi:hypothetical protein
VTAQLFDEGSSTRVIVNTDLAVTGKPAQFGRGVMSDVGGKLLGRFADCLATELAGTPSAAPAAPAPVTGAAADQPATRDEPAAAEPAAPAAVLDSSPARAAGQDGQRQPPRQEAEAIDLMEAAGGAVAKRVIPVLGVAALIAVLLAVLRRRR